MNTWVSLPDGMEFTRDSQPAIRAVQLRTDLPGWTRHPCGATHAALRWHGASWRGATRRRTTPSCPRPARLERVQSLANDGSAKAKSPQQAQLTHSQCAFLRAFQRRITRVSQTLEHALTPVPAPRPATDVQTSATPGAGCVPSQSRPAVRRTPRFRRAPAARGPMPRASGAGSR